MAFYAHPTDLISPGDIFPDVPFLVPVPPLKVARKSSFSVPAKFHQDIRAIFTLPGDAAKIKDLKITQQVGEETLTHTRVSKGILLSWGSQIEADERDTATTGRIQKRGWIAAPIFRLQDIPENGVIKDPETGEEVSMRKIVRENLSHNYFYLPSFPGSPDTEEHYVDFRKTCPVGIQFFTAEKTHRIATLTMESLNGLYSRLMWFFTRAEYFFRPITCAKCGQSIPVDIRFHGQNFDAEPWE